MKTRLLKVQTTTLKPLVTTIGTIIFLSACANQLSTESITPPIGIGYELTVPSPIVSYPLPAVDNIENNSNEHKYDPDYNPILTLLSGFNQVWTLGDEQWANGSANSKGPADFSNVKILDPIAWQENIAYVVEVTHNRTYQQTLDAYLDDRRDKNVSVIDGFGPLTNAYIKGAQAHSNVPLHTVNDVTRASSDPAYFDANATLNYSEGGDDDKAKGLSSSELGKVVDLVHLLRESSASTSPAKYVFSSPRPWRMNDKGQVVPLDNNNDGIADTEILGDKTFELYDTNVAIVPSLKYQRRKAEDGRRKDGAFPSGHTNAGYLASWAYAYAFPERFAEMITRGSELGESRIVASMHSPFDVIGGRIQSQVVAAAALANSQNAELKKAAYENSAEYFSKLSSNQSLYDLAHQQDSSDRWADHDHNKALYRFRMTYGFTQDKSKAGQAPIVPKGAEVLLETRQPYLTAEQRRAVLYTTSIDSGYPVLDESNGWGRLDYITAADGYGAFLGDVTVTMDADKGRFNAHDWWRNDISGKGLLTKQGTGWLTLTGNNSYSGGTHLKAGVLEAQSRTALGSGNVFIENGVLLIDSGLNVNNLQQQGGMLTIHLDQANEPALTVKNTAMIQEGSLVVDALAKPQVGDRIPLIKAKYWRGKFEQVLTKGFKAKVEYNNDGVDLLVTE
ncbi:MULTISPECIES: phosphatase PAP2 family protein [Marinomonas]|uniref:Phosphatase PAP2 family protein n=1 Tax=Marinomonas arctica TaxID=383750 RepID=A0A7H1J6W4_9GAMM|nr:MULTISPECIES: phosphatase PAP2 family protein [Marinomonas]QNT06230.1 phosphatase PAP2 family protein [Marinomonas arctica]